MGFSRRRRAAGRPHGGEEACASTGTGPVPVLQKKANRHEVHAQRKVRLRQRHERLHQQVLQVRRRLPLRVEEVQPQQRQVRLQAVRAVSHLAGGAGGGAG